MREAGHGRESSSTYQPARAGHFPEKRAGRCLLVGAYAAGYL